MASAIVLVVADGVDTEHVTIGYWGLNKPQCDAAANTSVNPPPASSLSRRKSSFAEQPLQFPDNQPELSDGGICSTADTDLQITFGADASGVTQSVGQVQAAPVAGIAPGVDPGPRKTFGDPAGKVGRLRGRLSGAPYRPEDGRRGRR